MTRWLVITGLTILSVMYYTYFSIVGKLSKEDLGPLGDFIGGNLNPLLTFISTIMLIETVVIQRKTAADAKSAEAEARDTIKKQSDVAAKQSFESSLFNLSNICLGEYRSTKFLIGGNTYSGSQAFCRYLELYESDMGRFDSKDILNTLEELASDALFDTIKNFSMVFRFINSYSPPDEKVNYISLQLTLMPTCLIQLLCIARLHSSWPILQSFDDCKIFEKEGVRHYMDYYS